MHDKEKVIELIRKAFRDTEHPGDAFLQGSQEGCEPAEVTAPFMGMTHWTQIDPAILDANYTALSFFSEGGFRQFLPAFLIADLEEKLDTADPVFHLTNGFSDRVVKLSAGSRMHEKTIGKSAFVNPRRYGAMTWHDHAGRSCLFLRRKKRARLWRIWNTSGTRIPMDSIATTSMRRLPGFGEPGPSTGRLRSRCGGTCKRKPST